MVSADERVEIFRPHTEAQNHAEEHGEFFREGSLGSFEEAPLRNQTSVLPGAFVFVRGGGLSAGHGNV